MGGTVQCTPLSSNQTDPRPPEYRGGRERPGARPHAPKKESRVREQSQRAESESRVREQRAERDFVLSSRICARTFVAFLYALMESSLKLSFQEFADLYPWIQRMKRRVQSEYELVRCGACRVAHLCASRAANSVAFRRSSRPTH